MNALKAPIASPIPRAALSTPKAQAAPVETLPGAEGSAFDVVALAPEGAELAAEALPLVVVAAPPLVEELPPLVELAPPLAVELGSFVPCVTIAPFPPGYCSPGCATNCRGTDVWLLQKK